MGLYLLDIVFYRELILTSTNYNNFLKNELS